MSKTECLTLICKMNLKVRERRGKNKTCPILIYKMNLKMRKGRGRNNTSHLHP